MTTPTMLIILDGFGYRKEPYGNAITNAKMPFWHFLCTRYPSTLLKASGPDVGLLPGYMGNSEVGHLTLGAGRVVESSLKKFHDAIDSGQLYDNQTLIKRFMQLKETGTNLHIMGLISDAGVHSHIYHLQALLQLAHRCGLAKVYIHAFLDGRDTPPQSAPLYLEQLETFCRQLGCGTIASMHGRFYAMDRDKNWDRTQTTYDLLCAQTQTPHMASSWQEVIHTAYKQNITDEFVYPHLLTSNGIIKPGDGVVFFNFRPDRARQLTEAFINQSFQHFNNPCNTDNGSLAFCITATRYKENFATLHNEILFTQEDIEHTLLDELAAHIKPTPPVFIIAETEKYAHVTYFFRGMKEIKHENETRTLIPSIKTKDYSNTPHMSAHAITEALIHSLRSNPAYFYLVNYANPDMVGHSGNFDATTQACSFIDQQLAILYHEVVERHQGTLIITGDHGNAEEKIDSSGNPLTAHTCNPVPFVLISDKKQKKGTSVPFTQEPAFGLAHVAPTILSLMGIPIPQEMEPEIIGDL